MIAIIIISIILCAALVQYFIVNEIVYKKKIDRKITLNQLDDEITIAKHEAEKARNEAAALNAKLQMLNRNVELKQETINDLTLQISNNSRVKDALVSSNKNFIELIENEYSNKEKEFDEKVQKLEEVQSLKENELKMRQEQLISNIKKFQDTYTIILNLEENQDKNNSNFVKISDKMKLDIKLLESIREDMQLPRVVSMTLWTGQYKKAMDTLCSEVLGKSIVCGIQKITNLKTNQCYIGQSVDIAKRWHEHAKCGLGIDTPVNNKLYIAMLKDKLENFSWEVLEQCDKTQLDEKEKFYIELFKSKELGYNSTSGNGKGLIS